MDVNIVNLDILGIMRVQVGISPVNSTFLWIKSLDLQFFLLP